MPPLDVGVFVAWIDKNSKSLVRIAVLGGSRHNSKATLKVTLSSDPTEANRWRNDKEARLGTPFIALVMGSAAKLNSLRSAVPCLGPDQLRRSIVQRAVALLDTPERRAFWQAIGRRFTVPALLGYLADVSARVGKSQTALLEAEPARVHLLGLLRQEGLFSAKGDRSAGDILRRNLELVERIKRLASNDRARVVRIVESHPETSPLGKTARAMLTVARTGQKEHLEDLSFGAVLEVLKAKNAGAEGEAPKFRQRQRIDGDALAVELLLENGGRGLKAAASRFKHELEPDPDGEIEPDEIGVVDRRVLPRLRSGTRQATDAWARALDAECWGGIVEAPGAKDFVAGLKLLVSDEARLTAFRPGEPENVREMLNRAVDYAWVDKTVLSRWDEYAAARAVLLPYVAELTDHPLMALSADAVMLGRAEKMLSAFDEALRAVKETADALRGQGSIEPAKRLLARTMVLDLVFVRSANETTAIAAATHPFHVWRWVTLAQLLRERENELKEIGADIFKEIVDEPPPISPCVLLSPFVKDSNVDRARPFVCVGCFGALPLFSEPSSRVLGKFGARPLAEIAERLVRLIPHSAFGLKVVLIDPIGVGATLEELLDLTSPFGDDRRVPLHATVYRTRAGLDATDEEDEELEEVVRNVHDGPGSILVVAGVCTWTEIRQALSAQPAHLVVVFEPSGGQELRVGVSAPPLLSPLVAPRAYKYDAYDDRLDVVVAGAGAPFGTYHDVFCEMLDMPRSDFVGRRSGASRWSQELGDVAEQSLWTVVVDQALEPTLRIGDSLRLDYRSTGGRDIVTFTTHPETVEELVAEAVRQAGLVPNQETVERTFQQVCRLSGEALLLLAKRSNGFLVDGRVAKGTLGVAAAARWYERTYPDAVMISLDDRLSRRWVLGHADSDNRHGDLLGVRLSTGGVVVEAIEVKTHADLRAGLTASGAQVEGEAATQVDQTIRVLRKLLISNNLAPLDRARQDILRDQLYRAVASRPYSREQRARRVSLLEDVFENGVAGVSGLVFTVTIASKADEVFPIAPAFYKTAAGNQLGIVNLVETEEPALSKRNGAAGPSPVGVGRVGRGGSTPPARKSGILKAEEGGGAQREAASARGREFAGEADAVGGRVAAEVHEPVPSGLKVLLGESGSGGKVFWEPHRFDAPLNNFGILVTGDSGSGKTQLLRGLIDEIARRGIPVCVFDFKNDYADSSFSSKAGLRVYDVSRGGIPFNPLSLLPDEFGEVQPIAQIHHLAGILGRIFKLGDQQESRLKKAMSRAYEEAGIEPKVRQRVDEDKSAPSFGDVFKILEEDERSEPLLNRLSPLFDLGLFPASADVSTTFERLISERVVLDLHGLPDDRIKAAVAEFIIVRLHGYILRGDQPRMFRRLLVFDEAWRVKDSERLQELAREGRAFGVGIAIGTQFPGDIRENLAGNLATQIFLHNKEAEHQKVIARALCGTATGQAASQLIAKLARLQKHEGFLRNQQYSPYVFVRTIPHYERE
jgi:hypothetical protein